MTEKSQTQIVRPASGGHDCNDGEDNTSPTTRNLIRVIAVEGYIAAGKTTLLANLKE